MLICYVSVHGSVPAMTSMMACGQQLPRWFSDSTPHSLKYGLSTVEPKNLYTSRLCIGLFLPFC